ncbi:MAG: speB 3 [Chthonomonadaceae bacterium]|nr:speB 3 [Chthonomonadaceae bacterium]
MKSRRSKVSLLSLMLMLGMVPTSTFHAQCQVETVPVRLRSFKSEAKAGTSTWSQIDKFTWQEQYSTGQINRFQVEGSQTVNGIPGMVLRRVPDGFLVFVPDYKAPNYDLKYQDKQSGAWHVFAKIKQEIGAPPVAPGLDSHEEVKGPLLATRWGQSRPYNDKCPQVLSKTHSQAGCVAIAMAQIMAYYKYPEHGFGAHEDKIAFGGGGGIQLPNVPTLKNTFQDHRYNWDAILADSSPGMGDVAQLVLDCGVAVDTDYSTTASEANVGLVNAHSSLTSRVSTAFESFFGFGSGGKLIERTGYSSDQWFKMIRAEIDTGHPLFFDIEGPPGQHALVIDGYKITVGHSLIHLNFGWDGRGNDFYPIDADIRVQVKDDNGRLLHFVFPMQKQRAFFGLRTNGSQHRDPVTVQTSPLRIGFLHGAAFYVQELGVEKLGIGSPQERSLWKRHDREASSVSIDGAFAFRTKVEGTGINEQTSRWVSRTADNSIVMDDGTMQTLLGHGAAQYGFYGWLPGTICFVMAGEDANSSSAWHFRTVLDCATKRTMRFNGWLGQDGKRAIVPDVDGPLFEHRYFQQHLTNPKPSALRYYVVELPSSLTSYKFAQCPKRPLTMAGKPFQLEINSDVEFSSDGKWAIYNATSDLGHYTPSDPFLISLATGVVRKLPGKKAHFLE